MNNIIKSEQDVLYFQAKLKPSGYGECKADSGETIEGVKIAGYGSTKDLDRMDDIVEPGAFEQSIKNEYADNPIILFQHDANQPIGKATHMEIDAKGLYMEVIVYEEKAKKMIEAEVLRAFSIGYRIRKMRWEDRDGDTIDPNADGALMRIWFEEGVKRIIEELELFEVSVVSIPANQTALFSLAKSLETQRVGEKKAFLLANPNIMSESKKNLLEKKEEAAPAEETPVVPTEPAEETPAVETPTEGDEIEGGETPPAEEVPATEGEGDETPAPAEGDETPAEPVETPAGSPSEEEVEEEPKAFSAEAKALFKEHGIDTKLFTPENFVEAVKEAHVLGAQLKAVKAELDAMPVKKALALPAIKAQLQSKATSGQTKSEKPASETKAGFKDSLVAAAE
jgi:HK97 family phage prohead protease